MFATYYSYSSIEYLSDFADQVETNFRYDFYVTFSLLFIWRWSSHAACHKYIFYPRQWCVRLLHYFTEHGSEPFGAILIITHSKPWYVNESSVSVESWITLNYTNGVAVALSINCRFFGMSFCIDAHAIECCGSNFSSWLTLLGVNFLKAHCVMVLFGLTQLHWIIVWLLIIT